MPETSLVEITEEDMAKCTNCKTCYQDVSELFEKDQDHGRWTPKEVSRVIPGVFDKIEITPDLIQRASRVADDCDAEIIRFQSAPAQALELGGGVQTSHTRKQQEATAVTDHSGQHQRRQRRSESSLPYHREDVERYYQANLEIEHNRHHIDEAREEIKELEHSESVELFQKQVGLLQKRLVNDPQFFHQTLHHRRHERHRLGVSAGRAGARLSPRPCGTCCCKNDDMSTLLLRFLWNIPLKFKRKFIRAIEQHLSDRYPMFKGLSEGWPGANNIPPYIRPAGGAG